MKLLLLCAKGFEMMEFSPFIDVFGWAGNDYGYDVQVETTVKKGGEPHGAAGAER